MRTALISLLWSMIAATVPFQGFCETGEDVKLFSEVRTMIQNDLSRSLSPDVEVNGIRVVRGADSVKSNMTLVSARMSGYSGRNKVNYDVKVKDGAGIGYGIIVEASYDLMVDVFVSARALTKGSYLTPDGIFSLKQRLSKVPYGAALQRSDIEGKILKVNVGQGVVLKTDHVTSLLTIKKGQRVDVVVEGNNITLTTKGVLRKDAAIGGNAVIYCESHKKEINGMLVDAGTVRVKI
ncbi:MAG: flagellar basal body P-ring formation protein FlgA [Nitrospirae bacterium]|nr:MAG: flagellar basal body P-ring formation protein FlgA [Nitrospirota bacterium]